MISHLLELRRRTIHLLAIFLGFFCLFFFSANELFHLFLQPLLHALPNDNSLIATNITAPLLTPIKLAADAALLFTAPFMLFHIWRFAAPGLYRQERAGLKWGMLGSLLLFFAGMLFCFYIILPYMMNFFANAVPQGVRLMPDMTYAADFITRMLLIFGLCFQVPLLCVLLTRLQWLDLATLKIIRPYVIVAAFILGMLLTPPDVLSQISVACPLCILYELGLVLSACFRVKTN